MVPTPLRLVKVEMACSTLGNFRKALRLSVWTAFGVLMRTRLVSCGKNFPRCNIIILNISFSQSFFFITHTKVNKQLDIIQFKVRSFFGRGLNYDLEFGRVCRIKIQFWNRDLRFDWFEVWNSKISFKLNLGRSKGVYTEQKLASKQLFVYKIVTCLIITKSFSYVNIFCTHPTCPKKTAEITPNNNIVVTRRPANVIF